MYEIVQKIKAEIVRGGERDWMTLRRRSVDKITRCVSRRLQRG